MRGGGGGGHCLNCTYCVGEEADEPERLCGFASALEGRDARLQGGSSVHRCVAAGVRQRTTVTPSKPHALYRNEHCWGGQIGVWQQESGK